MTVEVIKTDTNVIEIVQQGAQGIAGHRGNGWANYVDTQYTSGSPLIVNNARVQLTCNGLGAATNKEYLPAGVEDFWTDNKIYLGGVGDSGDLRINFTALPQANAFFDIELDIGTDTPNIIAVETENVPKGNVETKFTIAFPIFSLDTFIANGCKIYINTTDSDKRVDIYNISIFIKRDYKA
jgi:hypothetical protein